MAGGGEEEDDRPTVARAGLLPTALADCTDMTMSNPETVNRYLWPPNTVDENGGPDIVKCAGFPLSLPVTCVDSFLPYSALMMSIIHPRTRTHTYMQRVAQTMPYYGGVEGYVLVLSCLQLILMGMCAVARQTRLW